MGKHRSHSSICKERQLKLESRIKKLELRHAEDMKNLWTKIKVLKNIQSVHGAEIGKTQRHLKGRDLWLVDETAHKIFGIIK